MNMSIFLKNNKLICIPLYCDKEVFCTNNYNFLLVEHSQHSRIGQHSYRFCHISGNLLGVHGTVKLIPFLQFWAMYTYYLIPVIHVKKIFNSIIYTNQLSDDYHEQVLYTMFSPLLEFVLLFGK